LHETKSLAYLLNFFVVLVGLSNDRAALPSDLIVRIQEDYADQCFHSTADAEVEVVTSLDLHQLFQLIKQVEELVSRSVQVVFKLNADSLYPVLVTHFEGSEFLLEPLLVLFGGRYELRSLVGLIH